MPQDYNIGKVFKDYKDRVYGLAISISRNENDAQDIVENTFLKVLNNLKNFRNKSLLSTWIYRIAYNEALMHMRKKYRQFRLSAHAEEEAKKGPGLYMNWQKLPDEQAVDGEFKERIDGIIRQMPIKYRMPLLLNAAQDLSLKNIAGVLGLNLNSVKTRLRRGRSIIKTGIDDYFRDRGVKETGEDSRCNTWTGFAYRYAAGKLTKGKRLAFNRHIEDCPGCRSFLGSYLKAINLTQALECRDLPPELQKKIETFLSNPASKGRKKMKGA